MSYEDFTAQGWTLDDSSATLEDTLSSNSYNWVYFSKGADRVCAYMINFGINAVPLSQCLVGGITIDATYDFALNTTPVELAGGIQMGVSGLDDIKAAYGDPSDTYEEIFIPNIPTKKIPMKMWNCMFIKKTTL